MDHQAELGEKLPDNPPKIWLAPRCNIDERTWCEDDIGCCDECGEPTVEYIRADVAAEQTRAALAAAQAAGATHDEGDAAVHGRYWHERGKEQGFAAGIEAAAQWLRKNKFDAYTVDAVRDLAKSIPVNLPFERLPQHAADPGYGPVPPPDNIARVGQDAAIRALSPPAPAEVKLPEPTPDQREYLENIAAETAKGFDPSIVIEGPPPPSASAPAGAPSEAAATDWLCPYCDAAFGDKEAYFDHLDIRHPRTAG